MLIVCLIVGGGTAGINSNALSLAASSAPATPSAPATSLIQVQSGNNTTNTTTTAISAVTVTAATTVTNCSELPLLEQVQIDREELPELGQNLTTGDALEFAIRYEVAYAEQHVVPDDAGMSEPTATINQTVDGYLVEVSYIYGGTSVITA